MSRTVADAAALLGVISGVDPDDSATSASAGEFHADYTRFLDVDGLRGARIGVAREVYFGPSDHSDAVVEQALAVMRAAGAEIVDPADIPTAQEMMASSSEEEVLLYEFKADIEAYLTRYRPNAPVQNLRDLIRFNEARVEEEMPYFGQELFLLSQEKGTLSDKTYLNWLAESRRLSRTDGNDAVMDHYGLDALVMPSRSPAWKIDLVNGDQTPMGTTQAAAMAGYPVVTVPAGYVYGLPIGVSFVGKAFSEPTLIRLAYAFEQLTKVRIPPRFRCSTL
jgi:amidase